MIFSRRTKLPILATVLLSASLAAAATNAEKPKAEKHPVPHHKAHKATHPPATHHAVNHSTNTKRASTHRSKKSRKRPRGQQAIDNARAREIQEALLREHYLTGEPSGTWDAATQDALRRYQAQQGWQSKTVPDSRALIRLGLGPDHGHLLNPETAMTTEAAAPVAETSARATQGASAPASSAGSQGASPVSIPVNALPATSPQ